MYLLVAAFILALAGNAVAQSSVMTENVTVLSTDNTEANNEKFVLVTNGRIVQISDVVIED